MRNDRISRFRQEEDGAVTVDWVVLCAGIVGLCVTIMAQMTTITTTKADTVVTQMNTAP
jgi:hypothetical protein